MQIYKQDKKTCKLIDSLNNIYEKNKTNIYDVKWQAQLYQFSKKKKKSLHFPKFKNVTDLLQARGMGSQNKTKRIVDFLLTDKMPFSIDC